MSKPISPGCWMLLHDSHDQVRVFAGWRGGYVDGCSYEVSREVTKVTTATPYTILETANGQIFKCHNQAYEVSGVLASVIQQMADEGTFAPMDSTAAFRFIDKNSNQ